MSNGWTQEWSEEQKRFIAKLGQMENAFEEIFSKDKDGMVIGYEERQDLDKLRAKNKKIFDKLTNQKIDVAVVGLEKAGKSTLGNALIKNNFLPEYTERCTYTTTKILASNEDVAEVTFYSYGEFQEKFQKTLTEALGYNDVVDYNGLERSTFDRFWNVMEDKEPEKYQIHNGTTAADVRAMLDGKATIRELLGKPVRKFTAAESDELRLFITGMGRRTSEGYVERTAHPYAVKEVVIKSTQLKDMEDVVLYDVPGFDSPTQLHKKQTEDMLKDADAIILVTNVSEPSLKGTQLDMLRKVRDEDDVKLSAKTFVFGNKLDMARSKQIAQDNEATLRKEAVHTYQIAVDGRIVAGSAKAYLESLGILSEDDKARGAASVQDTLKEWGLSDGVETLREKMRNYYREERYAILRQRAEKTLERAEHYLRDILDKYSPESLRHLGDVEYEHVLKASNALNEFITTSNKIVAYHICDVKENRPFSSLIEENIEDIFPLAETYLSDIENLTFQGNTYDPNNYPATRVDAELREFLKNEFRRNIVKATAEKTQEEQRRIREELVATMLRILGMQESSTYKEELNQSAKELFASLLVKDGAECRFNSLVERFISSLIEAVITQPFGSEERYKHVAEDNVSEFKALAAYYQLTNESSTSFSDGTNEQRRIFTQILTHDGVSEAQERNGEEGIKESLDKFFRDNQELIKLGANALTLLPLGNWAKLLLKTGLKASDIQRIWKQKISDNQNLWSNNDETGKIKILGDMLKQLCREPKKNGTSLTANVSTDVSTLPELLSNLHEQSTSYKIKNNREEMLSVLNTDIEVLRDITLHAVVQAIGLEKAYTSVIENNVGLIRKEFQGTREHVTPWLSRNVRKILDSEFAVFENDRMRNETRKNIVESIRIVLDRVAKL